MRKREGGYRLLKNRKVKVRGRVMSNCKKRKRK